MKEQNCNRTERDEKIPPPKDAEVLWQMYKSKNMNKQNKNEAV